MRRYQTITTRPENWVSDKPVTGKLYADGDELHLVFADWDFLVTTRSAQPDELVGDDGPFWFLKLFMGTGQEHPTVVITRLGGQWEAFEETLDESSLSRTADDPIKAAMKVLSCIL
jgi:hypothetical protein